MLRMMALFGLIDRSHLPLSTPYAPTYGIGGLPASGALGALGAYPALSGMGGLGGISPLTGLGMPMSGVGALPGTSMMPGVGGWPGTGSWPGTMGMPMGSPYPGMNPGAYLQGVQPWAAQQTAPSALDGIWDLNRGGFVIIRGNRARFYASRDKFQDYVLGYDRDHLWWSPQSGGTQSRYRYRMQDDRMVLADSEQNVLLLRRRRR
jgi:hypothetical protein